MPATASKKCLACDGSLTGAQMKWCSERCRESLRGRVRSDTGQRILPPDEEKISILDKPSAQTAKKIDGELWVVWSDLHSTFMDVDAYDALRRWIERYQPYGSVANGDLVDHFAISKYPTDVRRRVEHNIVKEYKIVRKVLAWFDETVEENRLGLGNHCIRAEHYFMTRAPEVLELFDATTFLQMMGVPKSWETYGYQKYTHLGKLRITHGDVVRKHAGMSALAQRNDIGGGSVLMGHSHRLGMVPVRGADGWDYAIEGGHLSQMEPMYMRKRPDWMQGFVAVTLTGRGNFVAETVPIIDGKCIYRGEMI